MVKDNLDDALGDFSYLVGRLHDIGPTVPDETMIAVMLSALPGLSLKKPCAARPPKLADGSPIRPAARAPRPPQ